jgi:hypothetical protein
MAQVPFLFRLADRPCSAAVVRFRRELLDRRIVVRHETGMPEPDYGDHKRNDEKKNCERFPVKTRHVLASRAFVFATHAYPEDSEFERSQVTRLTLGDLPATVVLKTQ